MILDQMDPCRLKQDPETKGEFCTQVCEHCATLFKIPWKDSKSMKTANGGSYYMACVQRHLENNCDDEGRVSVSHSLQAAEDSDSKHDE